MNPFSYHFAMECRVIFWSEIENFVANFQGFIKIFTFLQFWQLHIKGWCVLRGFLPFRHGDVCFVLFRKFISKVVRISHFLEREKWKNWHFDCAKNKSSFHRIHIIFQISVQAWLIYILIKTKNERHFLFQKICTISKQILQFWKNKCIKSHEMIPKKILSVLSTFHVVRKLQSAMCYIYVCKKKSLSKLDNL